MRAFACLRRAVAKHFHRSRDSRFSTRTEGRPRNIARELARFSCSSTVTYVIRQCRWKFDARDEESSRSSEFRNDLVALECHPLRSDGCSTRRLSLELEVEKSKKRVKKEKHSVRNFAEDLRACNISVLQIYRLENLEDLENLKIRRKSKDSPYETVEFKKKIFVKFSRETTNS